MKRIFLLIFALVLCLLAFAACTDGSEYYPGDNDSGGIVADDVNRKLVYKVDISLRVKDTNEVLKSLLTKTKELDGYVQTQEESGSGSSMDYVFVRVRIPTEKLDEFLTTVEGNGKVLDKRVRIVDITTEYVNATARKQALESRKQMLSELLKQDLSATEKISVINEISTVEAELQSIQLLLDDYDSVLDYSTVDLQISVHTVNLVAIFAAIFALLVFGGIVAVVLCVCLRRPKKTETI